MKFDSKKAIKEIIEFTHSDSGKPAQLNVAWGVDKNFMFGAAISMSSILHNNKDQDIHLHLFTDFIDDDYKRRADLLAKQYSVNISIYIMDANGLKVLPCKGAWSYAMYFRFIAFEYLSDRLDTLLYIDADVICKGALTQFISLDLNDYVAAVIRDVEDCPARKSGENVNYFNSGVIYANLKKWKENDFIHLAINILLEKDRKLTFPDQDVLNMLFLNKVKMLPRIYNAIYGIKSELISKNLLAYKQYITDETVLIHYVGVTKPWNSWANYPSAQYFIDAWKTSPWSDVPLLKARTPKQYKKKSRHERLQGKYISSVISYIGYLREKVKGN